MLGDDVKRELTHGKARHVYLLFGSDASSREKAVELLIDRFCDPDVRQWCLATVDGREAQGGEVLDLVSTPPFMGDRRVVVARAFSELDDGEALMPFIEDPPGFSTLILVDGKVDRRRKVVQSITKHGLALEFGDVDPRHLPKRITEMARAMGLVLERDAVSILMERSGGDLQKIEQELTKLATFSHDTERISAELAADLVAEGLPNLEQHAIFDFVDAIAEGRGEAALDRLNRLLQAGEPPLLVLAMIARQFRLLLAGIAWRNGTAAELQKALELRSNFSARKALAQARSWRWEEVVEALTACADCDLAMKRGAHGRGALESLTVKLVNKRQGARSARRSVPTW